MRNKQTHFLRIAAIKGRQSLRIVAVSLILANAGFVNADITVPGIANPYLAGQPDGTTANSGDVAPTNAPVQVTTIAFNPGDVLSFVVTGSTNNDPFPSGLTPDGGGAFSRGSEHGVAGYTAPINSLLGVFLDDSVPGDIAPADFPFSPNDTMSSPGLRQPFFIGDGLTGDGDGSGQRQKFVVPPGATRLFLASADGCCWNNNYGSFDVQVSKDSALPSTCGWAVGEWHQWTNGHYYSVQAITGTEYSWLIARAQARFLVAPNGRPADLATPASAAENAFVFSGIDCPDYWAVDGAGNNEGPNLGGFQQDKNNEPAGNWIWVTGEPWSYTNWTPGEPNNSSGAEDFLTFFGIGNARTSAWNDIGSGIGSVIRYYVAESIDEQTCLTAPPGMVSWWRGEGNADDVQTGSNGILQNGASFAAGMVGSAFSFDGVDDQILVPHNDNQNVGSQLTIDAWVYPTSLGHGRTILQKRSAQNIGGYVFETAGQPFAPDNSLQFVIMIGGVYHSLGTNSVLTPNTWQHVAATYDGTMMRIFVEGAQVASMPESGSIDATTDPMVIGRNVVNPSYAWNGMIDEITLFNRALSAAEVQSIVQAGSAGKCHQTDDSLRVTSISRPVIGAQAGRFSITGRGRPNNRVTIQAGTAVSAIAGGGGGGGGLKTAGPGGQGPAGLQPQTVDPLSVIGTTQTDRNGVFYYNDNNAAGLTKRFYRAIYP